MAQAQSDQQLDQLIGRLHELFADERESDAQKRLMSELDRHMHASDSDDVADPRPIETLEAMLGEYEEEHPQVSAVLSQIVNALKNMGV
ncbi:DUF4404 family protein [Gilvimarinus polysaccharolyticus]|uniref:DUF4404 family protein n=1 Tax=Gilvimarinus polysaccharolyticus TaxID=863921 RepID=UPI0006739DBC|nr:DUF4404 family protein [Gilvimarinus polysaccharolyticus]